MHPPTLDPASLLTLGEMHAESRRHTEILLGQTTEMRALQGETQMLRDELRQLPDRLAQRIPACRASTTRQSLALYIKAAAAMVLLGLVVAGKLTWQEALPIIRTLLGAI